MAEAVSKMAFGNHMGVKIDNMSAEDFFAAGWGNIVCEVPADKVAELTAACTVIGEGAKEHIHVEFYIIENDKLGNRFRELLERKAREGVRVRVIYD